jgi:hypothetical protein
MDMKGNGNMAIKEITIGFSRTVNLGNYESARVEASLKWEVEGDLNSWDEYMTHLQQELRVLLENTYDAQINVIKGRAKT